MFLNSDQGLAEAYILDCAAAIHARRYLQASAGMPQGSHLTEEQQGHRKALMSLSASVLDTKITSLISQIVTAALPEEMLSRLQCTCLPGGPDSNVNAIAMIACCPVHGGKDG